MLINHFKIAARNLRRNRSYTIINVLGLALSIAVVIILFRVIRFETSFDSYHANASRLYQLIGHDRFGSSNSQIPQGVIKALKEQFPAVERATSVYNYSPPVIGVNNQHLKQENAYFIQPDFLHMIDVEWITGSPETSLGKPYQVVLDEPTAQRLFKGDAMGKPIRYDNKIDLVVSGIIKKIPANSQYQLQMMVSYETLKKYMDWYGHEDYWAGGDSFFHGYVLLRPGADAEAIAERLSKMAAERKDQSAYSSYALVPLTANHFDTEHDVFNYAVPRWLLYALGSIGLFVLFIACINFINIAVVQAIQRNKHTGIRKILGSNKWQIMQQFFSETALVIGCALVCGILLAELFLPYTGTLLDTHVAEAGGWNGGLLLFLAVLAVVLLLVTGTYPALILARFQPAQLLRSRLFSPVSGSISLRQMLVVIQFTIAQVLVICTWIGVRQLNYFYNKDLGFHTASIVTVNIPEARNALLRDRFRTSVLQQPGVRDVTFGLTTPSGTTSWWWGNIKHHGLKDGEQQFRQQFTDTNYFRFFGIPVLAGRAFIQADTSAAVTMINEQAARDMGFKNAEKALGQQVELWGEKYTVSGIVRDYHSQSLKTDIIPHIYLFNGNFQTASIRIDNSRTAETIKKIEKSWKTLFPDNYFDYKFLSDDLRQFYTADSKLTGFLSLFSIISIIIGCLGVYGLVSFLCMRKTKEIGIRKVLGARVYQILSLLTREFLVLVAIAFIIAVPIAWLMMNKFMEDYTYRAPLAWWTFLATGAGVLLIAMITISYQAVKTALANPSKSLRTE